MVHHYRIDMEGPGDDEELQMFDASRPTKRRGLLSLLESVRCEKQVGVRHVERVFDACASVFARFFAFELADISVEIWDTLVAATTNKWYATSFPECACVLNKSPCPTTKNCTSCVFIL